MGVSFLKSGQRSFCYLCSCDAYYPHEHAGEALIFTLQILVSDSLLSRKNKNSSEYFGEPCFSYTALS